MAMEQRSEPLWERLSACPSAISKVHQLAHWWSVNSLGWSTDFSLLHTQPHRSGRFPTDNTTDCRKSLLLMQCCTVGNQLHLLPIHSEKTQR
jgi:hypothetical protein